MCESIRRVVQRVPPLHRWLIRQRSNTVAVQRDHWRAAMERHDWTAPRPYGDDWGNPDDSDGPLGNYASVKTRLLALAVPGKAVVDLGSLAGKWTQFMLAADRVICVDLNDVGFAYIRQRLPSDRITFYLTSGNELAGIPDASVDLVFSMDTLVRAPKAVIRDYLHECIRVLRPSGRVFLHLPCDELSQCRARAFTSLRVPEIQRMMADAGLCGIQIDRETLRHGVIVEAHHAI